MENKEAIERLEAIQSFYILNGKSEQAINLAIKALNVLAWNKAKCEKKPLFTFEGHQYFWGDKFFSFDKIDYKIYCHSEDIEDNLNESAYSSKVFPTEQLCKEALIEFVLENHKISESERSAIVSAYARSEENRSFKIFYCEQVIKQ